MFVKSKRQKPWGFQCHDTGRYSHWRAVPVMRSGKRDHPRRTGFKTHAASDTAFSLVLLSPVAGHAFSPFRGFRGGKAITVSFGVLLGAGRVFPGVWILAAWYLFFSLVVRICPNSVRTCVTYVFFAGTVFLWPVCRPFLAGCWGIAAIVCLKHFREARTSQGSLSFLHRSLTWDSHSGGHR